jgi:hypothetical protein
MSAPSAKDLSEQATNDAFHGILNIYGDKKGNSKDTLLCMGKQLDSLWQKLGQAKTKNLNLIKPRQKVNLLLVGNHSAGKSAFINWYVGGQKVCAESQAQETQTFCFVTYGKKELNTTGETTLRKFDYIEHITDVFGNAISNYLKTSVVDRTNNAFKFVDLIDSPGLVGAAKMGSGGGNVQSYEFDIDGAIAYVAERCDLVYVFLDNHGGATQMRTMEVFGNLLKTEREKKAFKTHTFVTKIDQITTTKDLRRVHSSIQSELKENIKKTAAAENVDLSFAFKLKSIFIPNEDRLKTVNEAIREENEIDEATDIIIDAIKNKVSQNFEQVKNDCKSLMKRSDEIHKLHVSNTGKRDFRMTLSRVIYAAAFAIAFYIFICVSVGIKTYLPEDISASVVYQVLLDASAPFMETYTEHTYWENTKTSLSLLLTFYLLCFLGRMLSRRADAYPLLDGEELKAVLNVPSQVDNFDEERQRLFDLYLKDPTDDD